MEWREGGERKLSFEIRKQGVSFCKKQMLIFYCFFLNNVEIPKANHVKYLGMITDRRLEVSEWHEIVVSRMFVIKNSKKKLRNRESTWIKLLSCLREHFRKSRYSRFTVAHVTHDDHNFRKCSCYFSNKTHVIWSSRVKFCLNKYWNQWRIMTF